MPYERILNVDDLFLRLRATANAFLIAEDKVLTINKHQCPLICHSVVFLIAALAN